MMQDAVILESLYIKQYHVHIFWQKPGGPHVGPMNFASWDNFCEHYDKENKSKINELAMFINDMIKC